MLAYNTTIRKHGSGRLSITVFICLKLRSIQSYLVIDVCLLLTIDQEYIN